MCLERMEICENFRQFLKTPFLLLHFWCLDIPLSHRSKEPTQLYGALQLTIDVKHQKYENKKEGF